MARCCLTALCHSPLPAPRKEGRQEGMQEGGEEGRQEGREERGKEGIKEGRKDGRKEGRKGCWEEIKNVASTAFFSREQSRAGAFQRHHHASEIPEQETQAPS